MSALTAKSVPADALPVIDVSGLRSPDLADRQAVARELRAACLDKGFFYVSNHGVPAALRQRIVAETARFFALPMAAKTAIARSTSPLRRGYEPFGGTTLEAGTPPDLKEGFYLGTDRSYGANARPADQITGPDQWPSDLPGFRDTVQAYHATIRDLEFLLWRGLALSLDLAESHFDGFCHDPDTTVRLFHYPPQPSAALPGEKGAGAHTDFGGLTVLLQDDSGGLQIWDERQGWIHAPPLPDTFICNIGDLLARWTNDVYRSTVHRVVNISGHSRYSVPFHFNGNPDFAVTCLAQCCTPGRPAKYPPTKVSEHLAEKIRESYA